MGDDKCEKEFNSELYYLNKNDLKLEIKVEKKIETSVYLNLQPLEPCLNNNMKQYKKQNKYINNGDKLYIGFSARSTKYLNFIINLNGNPINVDDDYKSFNKECGTVSLVIIIPIKLGKLIL